MRRTLTTSIALLCVLVLAGPAQAFDTVQGKGYIGKLITVNTPAPPVKVDWGDGTPPDQSVNYTDQPGGKTDIGGSHNYAKVGTFTVRVQKTSDGSTVGTTTARVTNAPLTFVASDISSAVGTEQPLGFLTDENSFAQDTDYKVMIDWGDGTPPTPGSVRAIPNAQGKIVYGTHAYAAPDDYIVGIDVEDPEGAEVSDDALAKGVPKVGPEAKGRIIPLGDGFKPSVQVDAAGTAHIVWDLGRGKGWGYCQIAWTGKRCEKLRTFNIGSFPPKLLLAPDGVLYTNAWSSYPGSLAPPAQLLGVSRDGGATWNVLRYEWRSPAEDFVASPDGRFLYYTYHAVTGPAVSRIEPGSTTVDPKRINSDWRYGDINSLGGEGRLIVMRDGRIFRISSKQLIQQVADSNGTPQILPPVKRTFGYFGQTASSVYGAYMVATKTCTNDIGVFNVNGTRLGPQRLVAANRFIVCNDRQWGTALSVDKKGGRRLLITSDQDGCPQGRGINPHRLCLLYRYAPPGKDFSAKSVVVASGGGVYDRGVGGNENGQSWVVYEQNGKLFALRPGVTSEHVVGKSSFALSFKPNSECQRDRTITVGVRARSSGDPQLTIRRVTYLAQDGLAPRRAVRKKAPFEVDLRMTTKIVGPVWGLTGSLRATVDYRVGKKKGKHTLTQALSFSCRKRR